MSGGFRGFVAGCSRALASPWAMVAVVVYIVATTVLAIVTGGDEKVQLWVSRVHQSLSLFLLVSLHARDEQRESGA